MLAKLYGTLEKEKANIHNRKFCCAEKASTFDTVEVLPVKDASCK